MPGNPLSARQRIAAIIPAAGASTRLGRPKQLALIKGRPLLARVVQAALDSELDHTVLVLGFRAAEIQKTLTTLLVHPRVQVVVNPDYRRGLAGSLQTGLKPVRDAYDAVMILLADHPFVSPAVINHVLNRFQNSAKNLCVSTCKGRRGHPVCLGRRFYADMMDLAGDAGARQIFRDHPGQVLAVELDGKHSFMDIDSEEDLERANAIATKMNGK